MIGMGGRKGDTDGDEVMLTLARAVERAGARVDGVDTVEEQARSATKQGPRWAIAVQFQCFKCLFGTQPFLTTGYSSGVTSGGLYWQCALDFGESQRFGPSLVVPK